MNEDSINVFSDGGARGNPGPAACAFVVEKGGKIIYKSSKFLGTRTNNQAEYEGVVLALAWFSSQKLIPIRYTQINFSLDSELVARQINGVYKVKDSEMKKHFEEVKKMLENIKSKIIFKNIPREKNKIADFLVNQELDRNT